jgi:hypothetical protein
MPSFDEYLQTDVRCKYCTWTGKIRDCVDVLENHPSCPKCGCGVITEKEFDAQMDRVNGEEQDK